MSDYIDLSELENRPEDLPENLETAEYQAFDLMPPGIYHSTTRSIKARPKPNGTVTFEVTFDTGLQDANGRVWANGSGRKERTWISTTKFVRDNRPGASSTAAEYLRACGIDPKGVTSIAEAMRISTSLPVNVFVGWTDRSERDAAGEWKNVGLRTKDFNQGTKEAPKYVPTLSVDGKTYRAQPKVSGFRTV